MLGQAQLGFAAAKQGAKELAEMTVHHLECGEKPRPAFARQGVHRFAQAGDRLQQIIALSRQPVTLGGKLLGFFVSTQVYGAQPLA